MLITGIVLTIVAAIIFIVANLLAKDFDVFICDFFINIVVIVLIFIGITLIVESVSPTPQAIDVYRGNTTLQITYRDSIPIDSVVVFKPEFRK